MEVIKKIFKTKGSRVWFIVTASVLAFLLVASIILNTVLYNLIISILGSGGAKTVDGVEQLYEADFDTKEAAKQNSNEVSERIVEEGIILLKNENNALPLAENSRISVFGKNSVDIVIGGSGSGGASDTSSVKSLYNSLEAAGFVCNPALKSFYENDSQSGSGRPSNPSMEAGRTPTLHTGETPWANYTRNNIPASYANDYKDAALIVLSRIGGEGWDLPRTMGSASGARQSDDHYLQADANETALIREVCAAGFEKVIVIINVSTTMELGFLDDPGHYAYNSKIDAALWLGAPGESGVMALGRILNGKVTPSGRAPDTYARDFKADPTWQNFGDNLEDRGNYYSGISSIKGGYTYTFVDYEESIYVGYRYWETRAFVEGNEVYTGEINNTSTISWENWHKAHVVYPFGYGLSYTTFTQTIDQKPSGALTKDAFNVDVTVTNTGDTYDGKDTVQLYVTAPLSDKVEKAHVVLAAFAKTGTLTADGGTQNITLEIDPYDFASWDAARVHDGQTGAYVLEAGIYDFKLMRNAHEVIDSFSLDLTTDIVYGQDPVTETTLKNRFDDADDELRQVLSRSNFEGTFPQGRTAAEKVAGALSTDLETKIESTATTNPISIPQSQYPNMDMQNELMFRDMVGVDFKDERWEQLIDKLSLSDMTELVTAGAFQTISLIDKIGKPKTTDADGPAGFVVFMGDPSVYGTGYFCSETLIAATFNVELAFDMGEAVGNEGLLGNVKGDGIPYSGWYAPGINIHRSQFGGRNGEYFSEDGFLAGKLAASEIQGAASKGVYCYPKHFAANEQETNRAGICTWVTEQALRELYFKPFELAVKDGKATAMMSSFNRIGTTWAGGDYRLLTEVLREEWGFKGMVISDFNTNSHMDGRQMIYAGGDLNLRTISGGAVYSPSPSNATDIVVLRKAVKNILYTTNNSNIMNTEVIGYNLAWWQVCLVVLDVVATAGFAIWGFFAIKKALSKPEQTVNDEQTEQTGRTE